MLPPATLNVPPSPSQSGAGTSPPGSPTTSCPKNKPCIQKITAKVPGTKGVRKAADKRPDDILKESTSKDESLSSNPPVILVRGCNWVRLDSVTTPANQSVQWSVKPNENKESAPAIVPSNGGRSATLKTDKTGSFSVIGQVGDCKVVWNVVFVWVNVNTATSQISKRKNFAPHGPGGVSSGKFIVGQFAWDAQVKVKVIGGGNDQKLGIDKVKVKVLQNGVADTLTGNYAGGGKCLEVPKGGLPIVDANDASQPFVWLAPSASVTPNSGVDRTWFTGDSPGGGFPMSPSKHQQTPSIHIRSQWLQYRRVFRQRRCSTLNRGARKSGLVGRFFRHHRRSWQLHSHHGCRHRRHSVQSHIRKFRRR